MGFDKQTHGCGYALYMLHDNQGETALSGDIMSLRCY